jgi:guanyl-specific ribonuclease Sa
MALPVTDVRSNSNDQIAHAAQVLGRSKARIAVFAAMHRSRQRIKPVSQLVKETKLSRQRVLDEAKRLVHKQLVTQTTRGGEVAYERDGFLYAHREKIIALAKSPKKLKAFPTKYSLSEKGPYVEPPG